MLNFQLGGRDIRLLAGNLNTFILKISSTAILKISNTAKEYRPFPGEAVLS